MHNPQAYGQQQAHFASQGHPQGPHVPQNDTGKPYGGPWGFPQQHHQPQPVPSQTAPPPTSAPASVPTLAPTSSAQPVVPPQHTGAAQGFEISAQPGSNYFQSAVPHHYEHIRPKTSDRGWNDPHHLLLTDDSLDNNYAGSVPSFTGNPPLQRYPSPFSTSSSADMASASNNSIQYLGTPDTSMNTIPASQAYPSPQFHPSQAMPPSQQPQQPQQLQHTMTPPPQQYMAPPPSHQQPPMQGYTALPNQYQQPPPQQQQQQQQQQHYNPSMPFGQQHQQVPQAYQQQQYYPPTDADRPYTQPINHPSYQQQPQQPQHMQHMQPQAPYGMPGANSPSQTQPNLYQKAIRYLGFSKQ